MKKHLFSRMVSCILVFVMLVSMVPMLNVSAAQADKAEISASTVKVYFEDSLDWGNIHAYCYGGDGELLGAWPGTACTEEDNGIWSVEMDGRPEAVIFHANDDTNQTSNIPFIGNNTIAKLTGEWIQGDYKMVAYAEFERFSDSGLSSLPEQPEDTYRYFFYMPDEWLNDSTATTGNTAGIYWWEGTDAHGSWPGFSAKKADIDGVYYYDVPTDVTTIIWNNFFDGGADTTAPYYADAIQTRNIGTVYYDSDESSLYPDGTENFDGMIYVTDPSMVFVIDYNGKQVHYGEWFYYYGNGEYGISQEYGENDILCGSTVDLSSVEVPEDFNDPNIEYVTGGYFESEHKYASNYDKVWIVEDEDAKHITLNFSEDTYVESGCDYIDIYDENNHRIGCYTGSELAGLTVRVDGTAAKVRLTSDGSVQEYGFYCEYEISYTEVIIDPEYDFPYSIDVSNGSFPIIDGYNTIVLSTSQSWGMKASFYAYNYGEMCAWPGTSMKHALMNEYGENQFVAYIPEEYNNVIFNNDDQGEQTVDVEITSSVGLYTAEINEDGKYIIGTWSPNFYYYNGEIPTEPDIDDPINPEEGVLVDNAEVGDTVTYTVDLMAARLFENIQASITYDSDKLEIVRIYSEDPDVEDWKVEGPYRCPNLDGVYFNAAVDGIVKFNASNISGYDFSEEKQLVNLEFIVKDTESSYIKLQIDEMTIKGDGTENYFTGGCPVITDGIVIIEDVSVEKSSETDPDVEYVSGGYFESEHNYASDYEKTWIVEDENAKYITLNFSEDTYVEEDWDFIEIYDEKDELVGSYTGSELAGESIKVNGTVAKVRLTSDYSNEYYGFYCEYNVSYSEPTPESGIKVGDTVYNANVGDTVTYTVELMAERLFENIQTVIAYDASVLELVRKTDDPDHSEKKIAVPNLDGVVFNANNVGFVKFNASDVYSGFNFTEEKVLVTLDFIVKDTAYSEIDLTIEEMTIKGGEESYFTGGEASVTDGISVTESLTISDRPGTDLPEQPEDTYRYYFYMPPEWLNDSTATTGNTAGIYWWEGTNAHSSWPGFAAKKADVDGVYYYDVPTDVTTIIWNNFFDGGADATAPYYADAIQTRNIGTEYYDPDESPLYPEGTENFDGMIYVTDFTIYDFSEYSKKLQFGGEWFYYYGNGEYGTSPVRGESEVYTEYATNNHLPFPKDGPQDDTPDSGIKVGETIYNAEVGDTVTYTVDLMAARLFENIQVTVSYDSDKLELVRKTDNSEYCEEEIAVPNINDVIFNASVDGIVKFNASNPWNGYNFKEEKVLVTLDFVVKDTDYSEIGLLMEEMMIMGGYESYFTGGRPSVTEGISVTEMLTIAEDSDEGQEPEPTPPVKPDPDVPVVPDDEEDVLIYYIYEDEVWIEGCDSDVVSVSIPAKIEGYPVVGIDFYAFEHCTKLESITIPNTVTYIGSDAFCGCSALKSITIPEGIRTIEFGTFSGCTSLASVVIPKSVTDIESYAFEDCSSLKSLTLPDSVTYIGQEAFADCEALKTIKIGSDIASIGRNAFSNTAYYNNSNNWQNSVLYIGCALIDAKETIKNTYNIKNGTTLIADFAFNGCEKLKGVTIPSTVTSIGEYAFAECESISSITIPSNVSNVGWHAFKDCAGIKTMTIEHGATSEIVYAFSDCKNLADVYYGGTQAQWKETMFKDGIENLTQAKLHFIEEPSEPVDPKPPVEDEPVDPKPPVEDEPVDPKPPVEDEPADPKPPVEDEPADPKPPVTEPSDPVEPEPPTDATDDEVIFPEDCLTDEKTNISVAGDTDAELVVSQITSDKQIEDIDLILVGERVSKVFDITLQKDGVEVQPNGKVMVRIPAENPTSRVYRMETDGTLTDMNAVHQDGFLIFTTEHFSIYVVAEKVEQSQVTYLVGDSNGDGKINIKDATNIQKAVASLVTLDEVQSLAADSDQNGKVNVRDATAIQKFIASIPVNFPIGEEVSK